MNPYKLITPIETLGQERIKFEHSKTPKHTGEIYQDTVSKSLDEEEDLIIKITELKRNIQN